MLVYIEGCHIDFMQKYRRNLPANWQSAAIKISIVEF